MAKKKTIKPKTMKKIVDKVVKKKVIKVEPKVSKVEDVNYWQKRKLDDERKDWRADRDTDWVSEYWGSQSHEHRALVTEALHRLEGFESLFEVGCNCGPNLSQIRNQFPDVQLSGIDANADAVKMGQSLFGNIELGTADKLPIDSVDVILADAVLMYADPAYFKKVAKEFSRVAKKYIVLVEWFDESKSGKVVDGHWARDYQFEGFERIELNKITQQQWNTEKWYTNGYVFVFRAV